MKLFNVLLLAFCILFSRMPAQALPLPREEQAVESAGRTLTQTLAAQRLEQREQMRLQAIELARAQSVAFSSALENVLGQGSIEWLESQNDPLATGIQPVAGREGLMVSYTVPPGDPLSFLTGRSFTYDNAVGAVAFVLQNRPDSAREVLLALQRLITSRGSIGFSYQVDSGWFDSRARTGTLAWVGYAMAFYQRRTGDRTFQSSAESIAGYLKGLQLSSGSLKGGPDVNWVSTEHNVDAYFFYRELYRVTGKKTYQTTANRIKTSLLNNHWVRTGSTGHFLQGINDSAAALDANSWGAIFLWAVGRNNQAAQALQYVEATFKNTQTLAASSTQVTGYAPDAARRTVWLEGTLGVAVATQRVGQTAAAGSILDNVQAVQNTWVSQGKWHGALPYAVVRYRNSDGDTFSDLESVASTGWLSLTLSVRNGNSPFWDRD